MRNLPSGHLRGRKPAPSARNTHISPSGITNEENAELARDRPWLDLHRHGFRSGRKLDLSEFQKDKEIREK